MVSDSADAWRTLLREYYALRLELMQRHHEIGSYRRKAAERAALQDGIDAPEPLAACVPRSMFDPAAVEDAPRAGRRWEQAYRAVRDAWIARYLAVGGT